MRLDLVPVGGTVAPAPSRGHPGRRHSGRIERTNVTDGACKHSGDVILTSIAIGPLRARLIASCSLVSLAVQSLRSM
ncbi:hypothetical protein F3L20_02650 [Streptomyces tendae]|uniref:Uncharacterized protein n=1 Tax=Streptomyces tendae TaxID=1932 RepID=A0ABX5ZJQ9_STRTE|nr:hypothetical protein F3L20_02650 [Streptomyces tendae]